MHNNLHHHLNIIKYHNIIHHAQTIKETNEDLEEEEVEEEELEEGEEEQHACTILQQIIL
jgi:hypothetical protein